MQRFRLPGQFRLESGNRLIKIYHIKTNGFRPVSSTRNGNWGAHKFFRRSNGILPAIVPLIGAEKKADDGQSLAIIHSIRIKKSKITFRRRDV